MRQVMDRVFRSRAMKTRKEEKKDPKLGVRTEQARLIRYVYYMALLIIEYSGKGMK